jgi:hypothetical protein
LQVESSQKLSVVHAMILVAVTAPGLAMTRALPDYLGTHENVQILSSIETPPTGGQTAGGWGHQVPGSGFSTLGRPLRSRASYWLGHIPYWSGPCLVCWSLAATALSFRGPRPRPGPLAGSPGTVTGLAVAVALAAVAIRALLYRATSPASPTNLWEHPEGFISFFWIGLPRTAGYTVAVWWLALALGGRWSGERRSGSRLGLALGWCWIAMAVSSEVGFWCYALNY